MLSFVGIIALPTALYLVGAHSAWAWLYLADPANVPSLAIVPLLVGVALVPLGAWYGGARLLRVGRDRVLLYAIGGAALALAVLLAAAHDRFARYGTYRAYHDGVAVDLMDVKLGYALVALATGTIAAAVFVVLELLRDARRVKAR